jgi:DNA polymerase-3 subunit epsilon
MIIAGIDVETSGLDHERDKITELGAVLWDTERNAPVYIYDQLIRHEGLAISAEASRLTSIDEELLEKWGVPEEQACRQLEWILGRADHALAFEAGFDKRFTSQMMRSQGLEPPAVNWIDARTDLPYRGNAGKGSLTTVLANHEILNYLPHRALGDILCTCKLASKYSWEETVRRSLMPTLEIWAQVSLPEKDLARNAGFYWKPDRRQWLKNMKEEDYDPGMFCFATEITGGSRPAED